MHLGKLETFVCNRCKIQRVNRFKKRFERRYGEGTVDKFKRMIAKPDSSLADVGRYFGFSREYSRQVYEKTHGYPYSNEYLRKKLLRKQHKIESQKISNRFIVASSIVDKLKSIGFHPFIIKERGRYRILLGTYKLGFRMTTKSITAGEKKHFRFTGATSANLDTDFIICVCQSETRTDYYVIPSDAIPKYGVCLLQNAAPDQSKYASYKNAWHLLDYMPAPIGQLKKQTLISCERRLRTWSID